MSKKWIPQASECSGESLDFTGVPIQQIILLFGTYSIGALIATMFFVFESDCIPFMLNIMLKKKREMNAFE